MKSFLFCSIIVFSSVIVSSALALENDTTPADVVCNVKQYNGKPTLFVDDKPYFPMAFMSYYPTQERYKQMADHGIHFYSLSLTLTDKWLGGAQRVKWNTPGLWRGPDDIDFAVLDKSFKEVLANDPKAMIVARIYCESPEWWNKLHPNDNRGAESGPLCRQAFSSTAWRADASEAIKKIVRYVSASEYGNHVIGYMLTAAGTEELATGPDYAPCSQERFREWIWEKYGKDEKKIKQLFGKTIDEISIPSPKELAAGTCGNFLDPQKSQLVIDYREFHPTQIVDTALAYCHAVKEASDGRLLTGFFYGYTRIWPDTGHLALRRALESKDVDFITTPCGGFPYSVVGSHGFPHFTDTEAITKAGKLFYSEIDVRTSLSKWISEIRPDIDPHGEYNQQRWFGPPNIADSMQLLKAVYAKVLVNGWANWWFDLWGGWYDNEAILEMFAEMQKIGDQSIELPRESNAQIAVVLDENSYRYLPYGTAQWGGKFKWIDTQLQEVGKIGAPYEFYLLDDLKDLDMSRFRMVIFLNAFVLSEEQREIIRNRCMSDNRTLLWMYAPGLIKENLDVENVSSLLGMEICLKPKHPKSQITVKSPSDTITYHAEEVSPFLHVNKGADQGGDVSIGHSADGHIVVAEKKETNYRNVLTAMPPMPLKLLQHYAKQAGVHVYTEGGEVVFASNNYLAISSPSKRKVSLTLPEKAALRELLPLAKGSETIGPPRDFPADTHFDLDFADHTCRIFQIIRDNDVTSQPEKK